MSWDRSNKCKKIRDQDNPQETPRESPRRPRELKTAPRELDMKSKCLPLLLEAMETGEAVLKETIERITLVKIEEANWKDISDVVKLMKKQAVEGEEQKLEDEGPEEEEEEGRRG